MERGQNKNEEDPEPLEVRVDRLFAVADAAAFLILEQILLLSKRPNN